MKARVPSESPDMGEPDRSLRIETPSEAIDALNEFAALVCIGKRPHELYFVLLDFLTGLPRLDVSARPASASSEETPK